MNKKSCWSIELPKFAQKSIWKSLLEDNDTANIIESYALQVVCSFRKTTLSTGPLVLIQQTPGRLWRIYQPNEM